FSLDETRVLAASPCGPLRRRRGILEFGPRAGGRYEQARARRRARRAKRPSAVTPGSGEGARRRRFIPNDLRRRWAFASGARERSQAASLGRTCRLRRLAKQRR